jgi:hypothetical protein
MDGCAVVGGASSYAAGEAALLASKSPSASAAIKVKIL